MRKALAEFIGTALLLIAVVGSGIAAQTLSPNDTGLELLENAAATGAALVAIILAVGPVSGAHLNPIVSAADAIFGGLRPRELATYALAQLAGGAIGVVVANLIFSPPAVTVSGHALSDTFAGIAPTSVVPFVLAQIIGAGLACATIRYLWPRVGDVAEAVLLPHESEHEQEVGVG